MTITVDNDVLNQYKRMIPKGGMSQNIEDYMSGFIANSSQDTSAINIKILNLDIKDKQRKISELQTALAHDLQKKDQFYSDQEEAEKKRIESEQEKRDALYRCINCGLMIEDGAKKHTFPKGQVCNGCFHGEGAAGLKKWS